MILNFPFLEFVHVNAGLENLNQSGHKIQPFSKDGVWTANGVLNCLVYPP